MCRISLLISILLLYSVILQAQNGVIKGRVVEEINNASIPFANVLIDETGKGMSTDIEGNFRFENLEPGLYTITCSFVGFKTITVEEIRVDNVKPAVVNIKMNEDNELLGEVLIQTSAFKKQVESPVSVKSINATEILRSPGGNRDISKVIQTLPGVASSASFRNDIIIRGGAPNENRFYIDGIEVPNINHFATQGSSGGPVGMTNVNLIKGVDFYTGAFPANRGNALSSIMELKQIEGDNEKRTGSVTVGSSDFGLTFNGYINDKSTLLLSVRRSYLQILFKALKLPFLPTYNDFQYKQTINFNDKNKLVIMGLGAIDDFSLNQTVNDGITDEEELKKNNYILGYLPVNTQWNYTLGANWTHFSDNSYQTIVLSRNMLNNNAIKYKDNVENSANLILDYNSQEIENKFRFENNYKKNGWKLNYGLGYEFAKYTNSTLNQVAINGVSTTIDFDSKLTLNKFSLFSQLSKAVLKNRVQLSGGIRTDFNDYSSTMSNALEQLSPRLSIAFNINEKWSLNGNVAKYYQLPSYTILGYRNSLGDLENKNVTYISNNHYIAGLKYNPNKFLQVTFEGFYKRYYDYPFSLNDSVSLANLGSDFGVIGNEAVSSSSEGRSYGLEFSVQQKLNKSIYGILSYTFSTSEFEDKNGTYIPSAWDNRHILNVTLGKRFKKNWEVGFKFRLLSGAPYTPYDVALSSQIAVWDVTQQGVLDWNKINTERAPLSHGLDFRIDKKIYLKKMTLNIYFDVQNVYNFQSEGQAFINVERDASGVPVINSSNPTQYNIERIANTNGTLLPSLGLMIDF